MSGAALVPESTAALAELVRSHAAAGTGVRIVGRDTWRGAGSPHKRVQAGSRPVSMAQLAGIVSYVPADLTITVRAGTTLAELTEATARHHQWCPLLAWGSDDGTVGATFATATTGPCAAALGRPRDLALGLEFVDGTGAIVRGGGQVVKNVAGFDLTRLMVGAFGTLGIITEITMRLRARPPVDVTLCVWPTHGDGADALATRLREAEIQPLACAAITGALGGTLGLADGVVLVRYGGNRGLVDAGRAAAAALGRVEEADPSVWTRYREADPMPRDWATGPQAQSVAARLKARFDPAGILNAGLLGGSA